MRSIRPFALATGLLLAAAASTSAAEPELRRVLLSTGGVGYFGYEATPDAEGRLWLTVPLAQVDDILKSLTVLGADGAVRSVSLQGPTPLGDLFRDVPFGEGDLVDLPSLLARLRGAEVQVVGRASLHGRILTRGARGSRRRREPVGTPPAEPRRPGGHPLGDPRDHRRAVLRATPSCSGRWTRSWRGWPRRGSAQERKLEIRLAGAPAGPVGLGYLAEMPLWKASWRLVAGQGDGLLQGWAILENASGQDWRDVAVTLIGGSPRALRQALFASHYVQRPEVPVDGEARKERQDFVAMAAAPPMEAESAVRSLRAGAAPLETGAAQELTAQTLFPLPQPVTLPQGQTVMAPIVDRTVPIERVALYRAAAGGPHPSAALRLRNTTGASLPAGLATLYETLPDGGLTFLGDAPLPQLAPGGEELLAYGLDGNIDVAVQQESHGRVDRARVADGVLELTRLEQQQFNYAVTARFAGAPRSFVLEQTRPVASRVAAPADAVVEGETLKVNRTLDPGARLELAVVLERPVVQRFALLDHDPQALLLEFQGVEAAARAARRPGPAAGAVGHGGRAGAADRRGVGTPGRAGAGSGAAAREPGGGAGRERSRPALPRRARRQRGRADGAGHAPRAACGRSWSRRRKRGRRSSARCGCRPAQASVPGGGA